MRISDWSSDVCSSDLMLSRRTGCNIETIRYYEKIGLLPAPARSDGGHRLYGHGHLMRLGFVRRARELGFTLDEIRALLRLAEDRDRPCAEAREVAAAHLTDIRTKIADLQAMASVLAGTVVRCPDEIGRASGRESVGQY